MSEEGNGGRGIPARVYHGASPYSSQRHRVARFAFGQDVHMQRRGTAATGPFSGPMVPPNGPGARRVGDVAGVLALALLTAAATLLAWGVS